MPQTNCKKLN